MKELKESIDEFKTYLNQIIRDLSQLDNKDNIESFKSYLTRLLNEIKEENERIKQWKS